MPAWHTLARAPPTSPDINKDGTIKSFSDAGAALWRRRVPSLLYHEPDVVSLLVLSSFLYLLNVARVVFDSLIGAGLIGEIALGIVYEQAGILPEAWREFLLVLGYLGLVLIVFEGVQSNLLILISLIEHNRWPRCRCIVSTRGSSRDRGCPRRRACSDRLDIRRFQRFRLFEPVRVHGRIRTCFDFAGHDFFRPAGPKQRSPADPNRAHLDRCSAVR